MERKTCKRGHAWLRENLTAFKARGKTYFACRLCNNERSLKRNREKREAPKPPQHLTVLKTKCRVGHPLIEENVIRVGPRRQCRTCWIVRQIEQQASRKLEETRWLNGPRVVVPATLPAYGSGSRPTQWNSVEIIEHGPRRHRFNPWTRSFESKWIQPPVWQEILRQPRPTLDEMKAAITPIDRRRETISELCGAGRPYISLRAIQARLRKRFDVTHETIRSDQRALGILNPRRWHRDKKRAEPEGPALKDVG